MNISEAIKILDNEIKNPTEGLPDEVFYFISRTTPLVNVDLLIKDELGRFLLAWRDDIHSGTGWHIPGGIVRHKETLEERVQKTALSEIGIKVEFNPNPIDFRQIIHNDKKDRSHFISFLFECKIDKDFIPDNKGMSIKDPGYLMWHKDCPKDLLKCHNIYKKHLQGDKDES